MALCPQLRKTGQTYLLAPLLLGPPLKPLKEVPAVARGGRFNKPVPHLRYPLASVNVTAFVPAYHPDWFSAVFYHNKDDALTALEEAHPITSRNSLIKIRLARGTLVCPASNGHYRRDFMDFRQSYLHRFNA